MATSLYRTIERLDVNRSTNGQMIQQFLVDLADHLYGLTIINFWIVDMKMYFEVDGEIPVEFEADQVASWHFERIG